MAIKIYPNRIEFERYSLIIGCNGLFVSSNADLSNTSAYACLTFPDRTFGSAFQGTVAGYSIGGSITPGAGNATTFIEKFSFTSPVAGASVGSLTSCAKSFASTSQSSEISGYASGGSTGAPVSFLISRIEKFPFASFTTAICIGSIVTARYFNAGQSSSVHGYTTGGYTTPPPAIYNTMEKFPFANNGSSVSIGTLGLCVAGGAGISSSVNGYTAAGYMVPGSAYGCRIDKFPFAVDTSSISVGSITSNRNTAAGISSAIDGYVSGGLLSTPTFINTVSIDKFAFASDVNSACVGSLLYCTSWSSAQSSTSDGFNSGGFKDPGSVRIGDIQKFPFSSVGTATSIGCLAQARAEITGAQD